MGRVHYERQVTGECAAHERGVGGEALDQATSVPKPQPEFLFPLRPLCETLFLFSLASRQSEIKGRLTPQLRSPKEPLRCFRG